jgi:hypothetical protein
MHMTQLLIEHIFNNLQDKHDSVSCCLFAQSAYLFNSLHCTSVLKQINVKAQNRTVCRGRGFEIQVELRKIFRLRLKRDCKRAETRLRLSAKWTSPFKSAGASVQSITGSRGVRISGSNCSNAGYTMFRGSVKSTGYPLHSPVSPSFPLPWGHRVPSHFN